MNRDIGAQTNVPIAVFWLLAAWIVVVLITLVWGVGNAESKLREDSRQALAEVAPTLAVDISGRDATLYGVVASEERADEIVALIDAVPGVRSVNSQLSVVEPAPPTPIAPRISMRLVSGAVSLRGSVPDAETEMDLLAAAEEQFGVDRVINSLSVSDDVVVLPWVGRVKDVFEHLGDLRSGGFVAEEAGFTLTGEVVSESIKAEIEQELELILDETLPVISELSIAALPEPTFSASGGSGVVRLDGRVPNQETVDRIADAARRLHPGTTIVNSMRISEVAGSTWLDSIDGLLDVVTRLEPWTIEISDGTVSITGLSLETDVAGAIGVLTEEVVDGQLTVVTDVEVDPQVIATQLTNLLQGVATFQPNEVALSATGTELLDEAIEILRANPGARLVVEGHTDDSGDTAANLELSQDRAQAVVDYLIDGGIDPERLTAIGYGEERPIADNVSEEGRAQNRRIQFVIQEGDA